ncbi:unnamed protein product [Kuraishia capsulata CBS 1993]|uniref:Uncharacterized protein n=1 Tax=Kuraishia capsulata CBS 1993 TaxID=1382522 RepID=W6MVW9_9ASCO|nr:uncharacterized protein KUCA_T00002588001 [Kuraishia capsulata CBS 1993]CDK26615.1 unnamed protein product [Kuraishia capsulata CBS 1993]
MEQELNAITKFLESAAAAAAKETTTPPPVVEAKTPNKSSKRVFTEEELYALKLSPLIQEVVKEISLPDAKFWRLTVPQVQKRGKREVYSDERVQNYKNIGAADESEISNSEFWRLKNDKSFGSTGEMGSFHIKNPQLDRRRGRKERERDRKKKDPYKKKQDSLEWMGEDDDDDSQPKSAQDFENWKFRVKVEEKKQNGEAISEQEQAHYNDIISGKKQPQAEASAGGVFNPVDNMFAFDAYKPKSVEGSNSQEKSSRFSSFFKPEPESTPKTAPASVSPPGLKQPPGLNSSGSASSAAQAAPVQANAPIRPPGLAPPQSHSQNGADQLMSMLSQPPQSAKDDFFMSLLSKSKEQQPEHSSNFFPGEKQSHQSLPPPGLMLNMNSANANPNLNVHPNQHVAPVSNGNTNQQIPMGLPPWMMNPRMMPPPQGMPGLPYSMGFQPPGMYNPQQGLPQQGLPQQGLPQQGIPQQGLPQQGFPQYPPPHQMQGQVPHMQQAQPGQPQQQLPQGSVQQMQSQVPQHILMQMQRRQ